MRFIDTATIAQKAKAKEAQKADHSFQITWSLRKATAEKLSQGLSKVIARRNYSENGCLFTFAHFSI